MDDEPMDDEWPPFPRLDRMQFAVYGSFEEAEAYDRAYWLAQTSEYRFRQLRYLHWMNHGRDAVVGPMVRRLKQVDGGWLSR